MNAVQYKGFTITKLSRRGVYEAKDSQGNIVVILPLLRQVKRNLDGRAA